MRVEGVPPILMVEGVVCVTENTETRRRTSILGSKLIASAFTFACLTTPLADAVDNIPVAEVLVVEDFEIDNSESTTETILLPVADENGEWTGHTGTQGSSLDGVDNRVVFIGPDNVDNFASSVAENVAFVEESLGDGGQGEILIDIGLFNNVSTTSSLPVNDSEFSAYNYQGRIQTELFLKGVNSEIDTSNADGIGNASIIAESIEEAGVDEFLTFYPQDMSIPVILTSEQYQKLHDYMVAEGYTNVGLTEASKQGLDILSIIKGDSEAVVLIKTLAGNSENKGGVPQVKVCELPVEAKKVETITTKEGEKKFVPWFTLLASGLLAYKLGVRDRVRRRVVDGRVAPESHVLEYLKDPEGSGIDLTLEERLKLFEYRRSLVKAVDEGREKIEGKVRLPLKLTVGTAAVIMTIPALWVLTDSMGDSVSRDKVTFEEPSLPTLNVSACDPLSRLVYVLPDGSEYQDFESVDKSMPTEVKYKIKD